MVDYSQKRVKEVKTDKDETIKALENFGWDRKTANIIYNSYSETGQNNLYKNRKNLDRNKLDVNNTTFALSSLLEKDDINFTSFRRTMKENGLPDSEIDITLKGIKNEGNKLDVATKVYERLYYGALIRPREYLKNYSDTMATLDIITMKAMCNQNAINSDNLYATAKDFKFLFGDKAEKLFSQSILLNGLYIESSKVEMAQPTIVPTIIEISATTESTTESTAKMVEKAKEQEKMARDVSLAGAIMERNRNKDQQFLAEFMKMEGILYGDRKFVELQKESENAQDQQKTAQKARKEEKDITEILNSSVIKYAPEIIKSMEEDISKSVENKAERNVALKNLEAIRKDLKAGKIRIDGGKVVGEVRKSPEGKDFEKRISDVWKAAQDVTTKKSYVEQTKEIQMEVIDRNIMSISLLTPKQKNDLMTEISEVTEDKRIIDAIRKGSAVDFGKIRLDDKTREKIYSIMLTLVGEANKDKVDLARARKVEELPKVG
ncbi:MAG: hypothetical protein NTY68_03905 [Candidatus Micrarchaeota archaeon]|nr:hypothetical protein [Candidatus Micrarchaeota archaeon]